MDVRFAIALPRKAYSVAVMRDVMEEALRTSSVCAECRGDLLLAGSEACANVIDHGHAAADYRVVTRVQARYCEMEIAHTGPRFEVAQVPLPDLEAESGRGILLMRAFVDQVTIGHDGLGPVVRLRKRLDCAPRPAYRRPPRPAGVG
ncbi:ATP-binding protein [Marinactinospora rubrisoli]|uniref:ATP-binding protein n=1 Tax=Marinactinospora rubrisoli TaxID=2715399 RepID=A0ABW2KAI7_9ACTN